MSKRVPEGVNPEFKARMQKYGIPKWPYEPVFDRILVFQINTTEEETFKNSVILKADTTKVAERVKSPRGVLVAAGLGARDHLGSHGILLGDVVWFARHAMWAYDVDVGGGRHVQFAFLRSQEIVGSEDLLNRLLDGKVEHRKDAETGQWTYDGKKRTDLEASADAM